MCISICNSVRELNQLRRTFICWGCNNVTCQSRISIIQGFMITRTPRSTAATAIATAHSANFINQLFISLDLVRHTLDGETGEREECEGHILIGRNYCQPRIRDCTEGGGKKEMWQQTVGVILCMINSSPDKLLLRYNIIMHIVFQTPCTIKEIF